jgi:plastocyanin
VTGVRRFLVVSATAALLALPAVAHAAPREITANDDFFSPRKPAARNFQAGPSFHWSRGAGSNRHNIRQDDKLFRSGNPVGGPINFTINASAGSYHYYCELHGTLHGGMDGVVKVRPIALLDGLNSEVAVQWADSGTNTGSRFDVRYRVDHRRWKIWKNDTPKFQGAFGHNDRPVNFNTNRHTYKIEVRSERTQVTKRSDWSPALTLKN